MRDGADLPKNSAECAANVMAGRIGKT